MTQIRGSENTETGDAALLLQLQHGRLGRREFLRLAALLGLSATAAQALAGCSPQATPPVSLMSTPSSVPATSTTVPTQSPVPSSTYPVVLHEDFDREGILHYGDPSAKTLPTYVPPPALRATPTPTPVMWQGMVWSCPVCRNRFASQDELTGHVLSRHAVKLPVARVVDRPTYASYLTDRVARFDQRNHVFSRTTWDREYQAQIAGVQPRIWRISSDEMLEGNAGVAAGIYTDQTAGNLDLPYRGYSGHLQGAAGLYSWDDPVSSERYPVTDPAEMSQRVKDMARLFGADLAGITRVNPLWIYSHYYDRETMAYGKLELPHKYAIVMALEMDAEAIHQSPGHAASAATSTVYSRMAEVTSKLAKYIRGLGYAAVPSGNDTGQNIPLAIDAGLGEIGRLGLLLTPEFGARQRLCKVFTDLPLSPDKPIDFGMQRFCETCFHCAHVCPAQAIPRGERSLELTSISNRPGISRWHINVGKCFLFWVSNRGVDCSNCIAACPWSQPHRPWL